MRILSMLLMLLVGCATTNVAAGTSFIANPNRLVMITSQIDKSGISYADQIMAVADSNSKEPVDILINSPGGSIMTGEFVIDAIHALQARGLAVRCISVSAAASMAFSIFDACSERYALAHTQLLFHPARVMIPGFGTALTGPDAQKLADNLNHVDSILIKHLLASTGMDETIFRKAYYDEKFWDAKELEENCQSGYMTVVDDVRGIANPFQFGGVK